MKSSVWSLEELAAEEDIFSLSELTGEADAAQAEVAEQMSGPFSTSLSEFAEVAFYMPNNNGDIDRFSFEGRRHLKDIYDSSATKMLLICGRQVEKCVDVEAEVLLAYGRRIAAGEVKASDRVVTLGGSPSSLSSGSVVWKSEVREKESVRVHVANGSTLRCAGTHPVWTWNAWVPAGELGIGTYVASPRSIQGPALGSLDAEAFPDTTYRLAWTALALSHCVRRDGGWDLCCRSPAIRGLLEESVARYHLLTPDHLSRKIPTANSNTVYHVRSTAPLISGWISEGQDPEWVFGLGTPILQAFLGMIWALRGNVSREQVPRLTWQHRSLEKVSFVRRLLLRVGVACKIESFVGGGSEQGSLFYRIRLSASQARGLLNSLRGDQRVEPVAQEVLCPPGLYADIKQTITALGGQTTLEGLGLTKHWPSSLTASEASKAIKAIVEVAPALFSWGRRALAHIHRGDLDWSRVVAVEKVGPRPCVDFQVEPGNSFVADNVVTHNSTFLGNRALSMCALIPGYKVLYVSPSGAQTATFSRDRLQVPIETSPLLRDAANKRMQNVLLKVFNNQSQVVLRSAYLTADRVRGQAAYMLLLDELQDLLAKHIPVIEPATSHSPPDLERKCYSGTPKSMDNNIEFYRSGRSEKGPMSTMGEWMVPCDHCGSKAPGTPGRFWQSLGERNIAKEGLVCARCRKRIDPQHADAVWYHPQPDGQFESYRIPQLMVGWMQNPEKWATLWDTYCTYPQAQFYNEVLGLSKDNADRPLMSEEMERCCIPDLSMRARPPGVLGGYYLTDFLPNVWGNPVFMGVDWGFGTSSYTVITLGTYVGNKLVTFYAHRCTGLELDLETQLELIADLIVSFNVTAVGCDWGFGAANNDRLLRIFGPQRILSFIYLNKAKRKVQREPTLNRYKVFRTLVMADLINAIKRRVVAFPRWPEFATPFATDFTNITMEYSETQRMVIYNHKATTTDDTFHSWAFMMLASMTIVRRPDILSPMASAVGQGPVFTLPGPIDQG